MFVQLLLPAHHVQCPETGAKNKQLSINCSLSLCTPTQLEEKV